MEFQKQQLVNWANEFHHVDDDKRALLVGYYPIEPKYDLPSDDLTYTILSDANDILTNELLDAMGYTVQQQQQPQQA
eukprot:scaffold344_cov178-Ochromonas_danica.AAC.13